MKIYKKICVISALTFMCNCALVTGCSSSKNVSDTNNIPQMQPGDRMPDDKMGQFKDDKNLNNSGEVTYTQLSIEKEDIFTERDLETVPDISEASEITAKSDSEYTITAEGIYVLSGDATNFTVIVEADKSDKVQIVLNNASVSNDDFPVIYVKSADKCFVTSQGENKLSVNKEYTSDEDTNTDAVIFSKADLTLNGTGSLAIISTYGNGITGKDNMKITGGKYNISCELDGIEVDESLSINDGEFVINSNKDAIHCENDKQLGSIYIKEGTFDITAKSDGIQATSYLVIDGGEYDISSEEGMEATYVQINGGNININASDDGINASNKSSEYNTVIEVNDGEITIVMAEGDTDGLDANGVIVVNGGTIDVTGRSTFDYDSGAIYNGGTIIVNGTETDSIPESMMGGGPRGM